MYPTLNEILIGLLIFSVLFAGSVVWWAWPTLVSSSKSYRLERRLISQINLKDDELGPPDYASYIPEKGQIIGYYPYASWGDQGVVEVRFSPNSEQRRILDEHFGLEVKNTA